LRIIADRFEPLFHGHPFRFSVWARGSLEKQLACESAQPQWRKFAADTPYGDKKNLIQLGGQPSHVLAPTIKQSPLSHAGIKFSHIRGYVSIALRYCATIKRAEETDSIVDMRRQFSRAIASAALRHARSPVKSRA